MSIEAGNILKHVKKFKMDDADKDTMALAMSRVLCDFCGSRTSKIPKCTDCDPHKASVELCKIFDGTQTVEPPSRGKQG